MEKSKQEKLLDTNNTGKLEDRGIVEEMKESYLDYAMSVIVQRALPDVRDGMKPVHRRILYAMWSVGLRSSAKFRKSATIVGEVLGKYHPHGDSSVYDSMVRMAQDFALRYPLVWGQGNFGSIDGDSAAAYRYTEAKLTKIAEELLFDIEKNTVDFRPNFDGSHLEPVVLPAKIPNLLLNGIMGIAVGMATNIPPHHLGELCDGIEHLIDHPDADIDDLMKFIKGPDFPTGGTIYNVDDIKQAYATGKGPIVMRAKAEIEEMKNGRHRIIVTEIPYAVNKATLIERIATLVKDKKVTDIKDLRDESNKKGIRVVIELKKEAYAKKVLNRLYKLTDLQTTFHVNMIALTERGLQPRVLTLKEILEEYLVHREEVIVRRTEFELQKAKDREHILEGLKAALDKIDLIIATIRKSKDKDEAKGNLISKFKFTEIQAQAILEMRLQQLANLERQKIEDELKEKKRLIKELEAILKSKAKRFDIIKADLAHLREVYKDERRTDIVSGAVGEFNAKDLIPNESAIVIVTQDGYIKRLPPDTFKEQKRGGKGVAGMATKEDDIITHFFSANTHSNLMFFTTSGRVFTLPAYEIPQASRTSKGQALVNFLQLAPHEKVSSIISLDEIKGFKYMVMVTREGTIKKTDLADFANVRKSGLIAIKLKSGDVLEWVKPTTGKDEISLVTYHGNSIRFKEEALRPMGRSASGVRGIRLKEGDAVVGMDVIPAGTKDGEFNLCIIMENGYGKCTSMKEYKTQGRGGSGIKTANITSKTGNIVVAKVIRDKGAEDGIIISEKGQVIRLKLKEVNKLGRSTQGVRLMKFKSDGDKVSSMAILEEGETRVDM